jgi:hypothetical protein
VAFTTENVTPPQFYRRVLRRAANGFALAAQIASATQDPKLIAQIIIADPPKDRRISAAR